MSEVIALLLKASPFLGGFGVLIALGIAGFLFLRYALLKQMGEAVATYKSNSDAQDALLKTKDAIIAANLAKIDDLSKQIADLKADLKASEKLFQKQIDECNRKIELLSEENTAYNASCMRSEQKIDGLKQTLLEIQQTCSENCAYCKMIKAKAETAIKA